mmetsp:Transcript_31298/g.56733  ORF Transcript_31298/g.56733 Transcript_31298/m.56733 type:complete len:222 (-) Transcript_31298:466-1131(-)
MHLECVSLRIARVLVGERPFRLAVVAVVCFPLWELCLFLLVHWLLLAVSWPWLLSLVRSRWLVKILILSPFQRHGFVIWIEILHPRHFPHPSSTPLQEQMRCQLVHVLPQHPSSSSHENSTCKYQSPPPHAHIHPYPSHQIHLPYPLALDPPPHIHTHDPNTIAPSVNIPLRSVWIHPLKEMGRGRLRCRGGAILHIYCCALLLSGAARGYRRRRGGRHGR